MKTLDWCKAWAAVLVIASGVWAQTFTWNSPTPPTITGTTATVTIATGARTGPGLGGFDVLTILENTTVTIRGTANSEESPWGIGMRIAANAKVIWRANYNFLANNGVSAVELICPSTGTFEIAEGSIYNTNGRSGMAIQGRDCSIIISGGIISMVNVTPYDALISGGNITVSGGEVRATSFGTAISSLDTVTVSGGVVSSATGRAIAVGEPRGVIRVTGGLVIAQSNIVVGTAGVSGGGVVNRQPIVSGNGAIVGYALGTYTAGSSTGLVSLPTNAASWWRSNGQSGIKYSGDKFYPISGVTVNPAPGAAVSTPTLAQNA